MGAVEIGLPTADQRRARVHLLAWLVALPPGVEPALAAGAEIARLAQTVECGDWRLEAIELLQQVRGGGVPGPGPSRGGLRLVVSN